MQRLSEHAYAATEFQGCNAGLIVTSRGLIVIDPPMRPSSALSWRAELEKLGEVRYVINTEHHRDHILGNHSPKLMSRVFGLQVRLCLTARV